MLFLFLVPFRFLPGGSVTQALRLLCLNGGLLGVYWPIVLGFLAPKVLVIQAPEHEGSFSRRVGGAEFHHEINQLSMTLWGMRLQIICMCFLSCRFNGPCVERLLRRTAPQYPAKSFTQIHGPLLSDPGFGSEGPLVGSRILAALCIWLWALAHQQAGSGFAVTAFIIALHGPQACSRRGSILSSRMMTWCRGLNSPVADFHTYLRLLTTFLATAIVHSYHQLLSFAGWVAFIRRGEAWNWDRLRCGQTKGKSKLVQNEEDTEVGNLMERLQSPDHFTRQHIRYQ